MQPLTVEVNELRRERDYLRREVDAARAALAESEAGAASLREAIGKATLIIVQVFIEDREAEEDVTGADIGRAVIARLEAALATNAGRAVLDELERLRSQVSYLTGWKQGAIEGAEVARREIAAGEAPRRRATGARAGARRGAARDPD
jgi:hypothetical protein